MKWMAMVLLVGAAEVVTIGRLHSVLGLGGLVGLYAATTLVGAVLLLLKYKQFRLQLKAVKSVDKKLKRRFAGGARGLAPDEIKKLVPMVSVSIYIGAAVLIAIPGLITDFLGMLLIVPVVSNWLIERETRRVVAYAQAVS